MRALASRAEQHFRGNLEKGKEGNRGGKIVARQGSRQYELAFQREIRAAKPRKRARRQARTQAPLVRRTKKTARSLGLCVSYGFAEFQGGSNPPG